MRNVKQKAGYPATKTVTNYFSGGGVHTPATIVGDGSSNSTTVSSGALTAGALATVLTVTGSGVAHYIAAGTADATNRTVRLQVIADGVTVFDATSDSFAGTGLGVVAAGAGYSTSGYHTSSEIYFNRSLVVKVASSLTETDKIKLSYGITET